MLCISYRKKKAERFETLRKFLYFSTEQIVDIFFKIIGNFAKIGKGNFPLTKQISGNGLLWNIHLSRKFRNARIAY